MRHGIRIAADLQHERRETLRAHLAHQSARGRDVRVDGHGVERCRERGTIEAALDGDVQQHVAFDDPPPLFIVRMLNALQHRQRFRGIERLRGEHRGGSAAPRVEHKIGIRAASLRQ